MPLCEASHNGKTHLAQALGHEACRRGYTRPDLLIIDDFGLTALTPIQAEDFYEVVTERHLHSSILITSNRPPQDWVALFPDPVMANSALDRLSHHAHHIMVDEGDTYRRKLSPRNNK